MGRVADTRYRTAMLRFEALSAEEGKMVGELYGISQANVSDIARRKVWAWVA